MPETLERLPALVFVIVFAAMWTWEAFGAARVQQSDPARRRRNLLLSALNFMLGGATAAALLAASNFVTQARWGLAALEQVSPWSAIAAGVLLLDLTDYWRHRVSHALPLLWRLHRLHHTDPRIDVTSALRSHPVELLLRPVFIGAAILLFGITPFAVLVQTLLQLPVLIFQHANVRLPVSTDRTLAWLISTPAMHLIHHSRLAPETNSNYATGLTLWDRLFGSFNSASAPAAIGLDGFDQPRQQTLRGMLANPLHEPEIT